MIITKHGSLIENETVSMKGTRVVHPRHVDEARALITSRAKQDGLRRSATVMMRSTGFGCGAMVAAILALIVFALFDVADPADLIPSGPLIIMGAFLWTVLSAAAWLLLEEAIEASESRIRSQLRALSKPTNLRGRYTVGTHDDERTWHEVRPLAHQLRAETSRMAARNFEDSASRSATRSELRGAIAKLLNSTLTAPTTNHQ